MKIIDVDKITFGDVLEVVNAFKKMINKAPTTETEPIAHCKDCIYWRQANEWNPENYKKCTCLDRYTNAYFYCAYGLKKKEIVRCSDCKYNKKCEILGNSMPTDGSCLFGEKRTDEVNE